MGSPWLLLARPLSHLPNGKHGDGKCGQQDADKSDAQARLAGSRPSADDAGDECDEFHSRKQKNAQHIVRFLVHFHEEPDEKGYQDGDDDPQDACPQADCSNFGVYILMALPFLGANTGKNGNRHGFVSGDFCVGTARPLRRGQQPNC